jgi:phosphatidylglycerol:prolipoprotein diacylglycerol transferase
MRPFIFYSPDFSIPSFAFSLMLASLVATAICYKMAARRGLSQVVVLDLAIIGTIAAIIGIRLFHVIVEEPRYYWEHPTHIYQIWRGGFVSYGAFIGMAVGWSIYLRIRKLDTLRYIDHMVLFAAPVILFIVRIFGCLLAGCCFGKPSPFDHFEYLLYVTFTNPSGDAGRMFPGQHLWPVQIWEGLYAGILFLVCYWTESRAKFKGQVTLTFLFSYAFFRGIMEFFRGDVSRGVYFNDTISTAQITGIIAILIAAVLWPIFKKKFPLEKPYPRISPPPKAAPSNKNPTTSP